jgi:outer membrane protein
MSPGSTTANTTPSNTTPQAAPGAPMKPAGSSPAAKAPAMPVVISDRPTTSLPASSTVPALQIPFRPVNLPKLAPADPIPLRAVLEKKRTLTLSLRDAFQLAEGKNISLKIAQENQKIQQSDYWLRLSDLLPDFTFQYTQSKLVGGVQVFGGGATEIERITYQPQVTANYTVFTGGQNIFGIQASKHRLKALKNQTEATHQDMLQQVALAFYDIQAAYWQRTLAMQAIREAEQQGALTAARFRGGIGLQVDDLQAQSNLSLRQQELVQAEQAISQASENLAQLLNLDFEVEVLPDTLDAEIVQRIPDSLTVKEMLAIAKAHNPNLARLHELARAGKSDVNVSVASLFPQINITSYRNRTGDSPSTWLPTRYSGIQANWNILENSGLARPIAIRQAKANMEVARYNQVQGERMLQQNIVNGWIGLNALRQTITAARSNLQYSQLAYEQASGRLREGVGTNVELQISLTNLARARSDLAAAFLNYNRLQTTLLFNLGVLSPGTMANGYHPSPSS